MKIVKSPRLADRVLYRLAEKSELRQIGDELDLGAKAAVQERGRVAEFSLTESLWLQSSQWADKALATEFIQGMKTGSCDPNDFGIYNMQDSVYCYNATIALMNVVSKSTGDMKEYAEAKVDSYKEYTEELFKLWYIQNPDAIFMGPAAKGYSDFELKVSLEMEPIYSFIAMIPCSRLWPWLGEQLKPYQSQFGVYKDWIEGNLTGTGYKNLEAFVNKYSATVDRNKALEVYTRCMEGEADFFASAVVNL